MNQQITYLGKIPACSPVGNRYSLCLLHKRILGQIQLYFGKHKKCFFPNIIVLWANTALFGKYSYIFRENTVLFEANTFLLGPIQLNLGQIQSYLRPIHSYLGQIYLNLGPIHFYLGQIRLYSEKIQQYLGANAVVF